MRSDFYGWYFRCQSSHQTLAVIPSIHRTKISKYCAIQLITDSQSFHIPLPYPDFRKKDEQICLAGNLFGKEGIRLDIHTSDLNATGSV